MEPKEPKDVRHPNWQFCEIIYRDRRRDKAWSVAKGRWKNEPVLAIRWDGNERKPNGYPLAGSQPAWFILPAALNEIAKLNGTAGFSRSYLAKLNDGFKFSPKADWREGEAKIIYGDKEKNKEWWVAEGEWKWNGVWCREMLAIRWAGKPGFPSSRGKPTWFVFPPELKALIRAAISNETA